MIKPLTILSLGAGVQSSTIALMATHGEITPMPDAAIFADTFSESPEVYKWLNWLEKQLPFPVLRTHKAEGVKSAVLDAATDDARVATPPFYVDVNGNDRPGLLRRQCTREFKIEPITKLLREMIGLKKGQRAPKDVRVIQWIGISLDEIQRMKDAPHPWIKNTWPLIERRMTRGHCLEWMERNGYPKPPKSACTFCPYRDNAGWREMKKNDPEAWLDACSVDLAIRPGFGNRTTGELFVHKSATPLMDADISDPAEGQVEMSFMDECDGLCGV